MWICGPVTSIPSSLSKEIPDGKTTKGNASGGEFGDFATFINLWSAKPTPYLNKMFLYQMNTSLTKKKPCFQPKKTMHTQFSWFLQCNNSIFFINKEMPFFLEQWLILLKNALKAVQFEHLPCAPKAQTLNSIRHSAREEEILLISPIDGWKRLLVFISHSPKFEFNAQ